eukprot:Em0001g726a
MGKKVLEMNQELHNKMEDMTREFTKQLTQKVEALVQEKHVLQQKAESQRAVIQSLQHDLEGSRRRHEQERAEELKRAEELHAKQVHRLTKLSNDLKGEVEKLEMKVKMYEEKLHKQEEKLGRLSEELANKCNTTCLVTELQDMEQLLARQRARSEELEGRLMEVCGKDEVLSTYMYHHPFTKVVIDVHSPEVKDQNVVLSKELEMMQLQSEDDTHQKKGNSLFGEVEDRRREIELQMMTLQVKYDTMDKTHTFTKQQLKKLKSEMSALLCRHGATTADVDHMHRLQRQVEQLKSENQQLEAKVSKLSKLKPEVPHSVCGLWGQRATMKILQQELEREKSAKSSVCKELELKRLQLVWEGNKLGDAEYKLHQSEQEQVVLKKELTRARLQLQEVTEKLNDATSTSKKLECQNKLLEEELTAKGKRKTVTCKPSDNPSFQESVRGQERKGDENSVEECGKAQQPAEVKGVWPAEVKGVGPAVPPAEARRRVSILEDLEKELNKEKGGPLAQQQHGLYPLATKKRPLPSYREKYSPIKTSCPSYSCDSPEQGEQNTAGCEPVPPAIG